MADPGLDPKDLNESIQNVVQLQRTLGEAADRFRDFVKTAKDSGHELKNISSLSTQINNELKHTLVLQGKIGNEYIKISRIEAEIAGYTKKSQVLQSHINLILTKQARDRKIQEKHADDIVSRYQKLNDIQKNILKTQLEYNNAVGKEKGTLSSRLSREKLKYQKELDAINKEMEAEGGGINKDLTQRLVMLKLQKATVESTADVLREDVEKQKEYNKWLDSSVKKLGVFGGIIKGLSKIPIIGNVLDTKTILENMKEAALLPGSSKWSVFKEGVKSLGVELGRIFLDPLSSSLILFATFEKIVKLVFQFDKNITDTANNLAISKESALSIYDTFRGIALNSTKYVENLNNSFLTVTNQGKALNELQGTLGTNALLTEKTLQNQIFLTKQMGMSAEEADKIQRLALSNNKSSQDVLKTIIKQNNSVISYRKIIADVANINGQLVAQYANSPELLAKAVVQAEKLGITLEQAKNASNFLLDFQNSIQAEMEAELVTGKQLNLEYARALALQGDSADAAKEMLSQVGSFQDYAKLNVIQQNSLAQAIGMSSDELTDALKQQQVLNQLGFENRDALQQQYDLYKKNNDQVSLTRLQNDILAKQNGDLLLKNISQVSLQERFSALVDKIKDTIASIGSGPIIHLLNGFAKLVENASVFKGILYTIGGILAGIAATTIITSFVANPIMAGIGFGLGAAAVAALSSYGKPVQDALITPSGQVAISTPAGMIVPDKRDSVITTTNPDGLLQSGQSNSGVEERLDALINIMRRSGRIYMDSKEVGSALGQSYSPYA